MVKPKRLRKGDVTPIGIIPYGIMAELDCEKKTVRFLESATVE